MPSRAAFPACREALPVRRRVRYSTGERRDDGVRVIRSGEIRDPVTGLPVSEPMPAAAPPGDSDTRRLAPARDAGIEVTGLTSRAERLRVRKQIRLWTIVGAVALALLLALGGWRYSSDRRAASDPLAGLATNSATAVTRLISGHSTAAEKDTAPAFREVKPKPTPYFAYYKSLNLRLPIAVDSLSEIGFHQASYAYALRMKTRLPDADLEKARVKRGTGRAAQSTPTDSDAWLDGKVLRMWRSRPGKPDTAVDVGAKPGTTILSPVDGTVVKVKSYKLYGRYPDYEIHIQPEGWPSIDLVMIHATDVQVVPGDKVEAGITKIAAVRKLSDKIHDQLADYTKDGGNHVHMQLNNADYPGYKGLQGAIEPQS
jgi:murein DD-endopeptidase MepM/ murein hydrolase activator NlpD